jgi:O-antigen ligase
MNKPFLHLTRLALFAVFLTLPFSSVRAVVSGIPVYLPEMVIILAGLSSLLAVKRHELSLRTIPAILGVGFLALLSGVALSAYVAGMTTEPALGAIKSWIVFPAIFSFLLLQILHSEHDIREAFLVWFLVSATVALATLFPGPTATTTYDGRLLSFFPSPNHLALFLLPGSVIGWHFVSGLKHLPRHFLALALEGVVLLALFRTESEGAMVASFLGMAAFFIGTLFGKRAALRFLGSLLLLITLTASGLVFSGTWERYASGEVRHSLASRVMIWNAASSIAVEHPFFGIGPRQFQETYLAIQDAYPPYLEWAVPHPHNVFLSIFLSGGLLALFGFFVLLGVLFVGSTSGLSRRGNTGRLIPATLFGLGTAFILAGLVDETYFKNDLALSFSTMVAFSGYFLVKKKSRGETSAASETK